MNKIIPNSYNLGVRIKGKKGVFSNPRLVRRAKALKAKGYSIRGIAAYLTKKLGRPVHKSCVQKWVKYE